MLAACGPSAQQVAVANERAAQGALELQLQLHAEAEAAAAGGSPARAFGLYADLAQPLTARFGAALGMSVRRVSLAPYNPADTPDAYERAFLERIDGQPFEVEGRSEGAAGEVLAAPGGGHELRYLAPIVVLPVCTTCHGPREQLDPGVLAALQERYPSREPSGWRAHHLHGAVSVRIPLP